MWGQSLSVTIFVFQKLQNGHVKGKDVSISKGFSQVGHMLKNTEGSRYPQLFKQKWKIEDCDFVSSFLRKRPNWRYILRSAIVTCVGIWPRTVKVSQWRKITIIFEWFIVLMWKYLNFQLFCFCYSVVNVGSAFTEAQPGSSLTALCFEIVCSLLRKIVERGFQILTLMNFHEPLEIKCNFQRPSSSDSPLTFLFKNDGCRSTSTLSR